MRQFFWLTILLPLLSQAQVLPTPAPRQSKPILVTGATVHVGNGQVIENGRVLFDGGKLVQVGAANEAHPLDATAQRVDATGKHVYPGLIALNTQIGLIELSLGGLPLKDDEERSGDNNPNVRTAVAYNTDSHVPPTIRSNGVLVAELTPSGDGIAGVGSLAQLDAWNWEDATPNDLRDNGLHINWPSMVVFANPTDDAKVKEAREGIQKKLTAIHDAFRNARNYADARAAGSVKAVDLRLEALLPFVRGEKPVYVHADEQPQLEAAVALAAQYKLKLVIVGGYDAIRVADLLKRNNIPVVYATTHQLPNRADEDVDLPYRMPKLLHDAGVTYAIAHSGYWQHRNLPFIAGTAAAYGLTKEQALTAITLAPARIAGVDEHLGSLEVGKDATLVISEGDILDMRTSRITHAWIDGRTIDLDDKHKQLYRRFQQKYEQQKAAR